jgi:hypothetical protein
VSRGRSQSGDQRDLEAAVEGNLIGNMLHALDAAEVRQKLVLQLYGTKLTIKAAAIIPIREQAAATITISRMTTTAHSVQHSAIGYGFAKVLQLFHKLVAVGEQKPATLHFQKILA